MDVEGNARSPTNASQSNEFALADRESEGESEGCEAQLLRMLVRILVGDYLPNKKSLINIPTKMRSSTSLYVGIYIWIASLEI